MTAVYTKTSIAVISATHCQKSHRRVDLKPRDVYESLLQDYNSLKSHLSAIKCSVNRIRKDEINEVISWYYYWNLYGWIIGMKMLVLFIGIELSH
jgi:hypothetical protein